MAMDTDRRWTAMLCADWSGSSRKAREVYAAIPSARVIRRLEPPPPPNGGWTVASVVHAAAAQWKDGRILIGFDAPIGMPRSLWNALQSRRGGGAATFAQWLRAYKPIETLLDPVATPEEWTPERPFFRVRKGRGGRNDFERAAQASGVDLYRRIDRKTGARSPFIASGIAGVAGGSARDLWRDFRSLRGNADPPLLWPFEASAETDADATRIVVAEIYPRLASGIAFGCGAAPWRIPRQQRVPREGFAELRAAAWVREHRVQIDGHGGFEGNEHAFDALVSAAALLRLVLEGKPLSDSASDDPVAEGGMLGSGAIRWDANTITTGAQAVPGSSMVTVKIAPSFRPALRIDLLKCDGAAGRSFVAHCSMGVESWDEQIGIDLVDRVTNLISDRRVPLRTAGSIGLDGTTFQVSFRDGANTSLFEWRDAPPPGWEPLGELIDLLHRAAARGRYA
jgi:hypothetical protein